MSGAPMNTEVRVKCQIEGCEEDAWPRHCCMCNKRMCIEHRYDVQAGGVADKACEDCIAKFK